MTIDALLGRLGIQFPLVQAPMAGGVTTPTLVAAVAEAGALGSIGAPYYTAAEISAAAEETRRLTRKPFALNLFIPLAIATPADEGPALDQTRAILDTMRDELGLPRDPPPPGAPAYTFDTQFEAMLRARPAVLSFTMGIPDRDRMNALRAAGIVTIGTATTLDEGLALDDAGVDVVCAQGSEAGGHRGSFLVRSDEGLVGIATLVRQLVARVRAPVIAAGGIMDGRGIASMLVLGASGAQLGTAFLSCPEAGTAPAHRAALRSPRAERTVITAGFSGRHGRAIANRYTEALATAKLPSFPSFLGRTRDVRVHASKLGRIDFMQLWAGQGAPLSRELPAAELVATLRRETLEALRAAPGLLS